MGGNEARRVVIKLDGHNIGETGYMVVTHFSSAPKTIGLYVFKATVLDLFDKVPTFVCYKWQPYKSPQLYHGFCEIMTNTVYRQPIYRARL